MTHGFPLLPFTLIICLGNQGHLHKDLRSRSSCSTCIRQSHRDSKLDLQQSQSVFSVDPQLTNWSSLKQQWCAISYIRAYTSSHHVYNVLGTIVFCSRSLTLWAVSHRNTGSCLQVEAKLDQLANLLPDITGKLDRARADVLYELLKDITATSDRLLALREVMPQCNVSALVAGHPRLMLGMTVSVCRRSNTIQCAKCALCSL